MLNVNIPRFGVGQGKSFKFEFTQAGYFAIPSGTIRIPFGEQIREDLREDSVVGRRFKKAKTALAGIGIALNKLKIADETNPMAEALHVASVVESAKVTKPGFVTISVINSNLGAGAEKES